MQPEEAPFTPEKIDQQIDLLRASSAMAQSAQLIQDLQALYATGSAQSPAIAQSWARIQARMGTAAPAPLIDEHAGFPDRQPTIVQSQGDGFVSNDLQESVTVSQQPSTTGSAKTRAPARRGWGGAVAAMLVILLAATIFAFRPGINRPVSKPGTGQATSTIPTPQDWTHVTALDDQAPYVLTTPAIAPSNPNVVYEAYRSPVDPIVTDYRRSDDGGKTWHDLTFPVPGNTDHTYFTTFVSPLDPNTVFLQIFESDAAYCPADVQIKNTESGGIYCFIQYMSTDGGVNWQLQHLPFNATFIDLVRQQGTRLYQALQCNDFSCTRVITSTDGGKTWNLADNAINSSGQTVCEFDVTPTGSTVVALAATACGSTLQQPIHLWLSNDAGATWHDNGTTPTPNPMGMAVTANGNQAEPLIYSDLAATTSIGTDKEGGKLPMFSALPSDVKVTADGGQTWQNAPAAGIPATQNVLRLLGALHDGSILIECVPAPNNLQTNYDFQGSTYYTWKRGETNWQQLGNPTIGNLINFTVTAGNSPRGTIWLLTVNRQSLAAQVYKI